MSNGELEDVDNFFTAMGHLDNLLLEPNMNPKSIPVEGALANIEFQYKQVNNLEHAYGVISTTIEANMYRFER